MARVDNSCRFLCHKWLLFTICFVLIYFDLMLILFSQNIADANDDDEQAKKAINGTIMAESILSIMFSVFGVIGAYRESYCCTVLFSVFMTLSVIAEIYSSIIAPVFWFLTIFYIFITMIAISFARLIREHLIEQVLGQQSAYMHDYGRTHGLRINSYCHLFNQRNRNVVQFQTIELEGRQLPPYYSDGSPTLASDLHTRVLPAYEEQPSYPPSYQECIRNSNQTNENTSDNNFVQHI